MAKTAEITSNKALTTQTPGREWFPVCHKLHFCLFTSLEHFHFLLQHDHAHSCWADIPRSSSSQNCCCAGCSPAGLVVHDDAYKNPELHLSVLNGASLPLPLLNCQDCFAFSSCSPKCLFFIVSCANLISVPCSFLFFFLKILMKILCAARHKTDGFRLHLIRTACLTVKHL